MNMTLKRLFLGGKVAELSRLVNNASRLRFEGDYFKFLTSYHAAVTQIKTLDITGKIGYDMLTMQFLNKLPKLLGAITHPLKGEVESSEQEGKELWDKAYNKILNYLMDCGLFVLKKKTNVEKPINLHALQAKTNSKREKKKVSGKNCWHCGKSGHFRNNCPELNPWTRKSKDQPKAEARMVGDSTHKLNFLLDSGATHHICGDLNMFKEIKEIPRCEVETANGSLEYSQMGHVVITLENRKLRLLST